MNTCVSCGKSKRSLWLTSDGFCEKCAVERNRIKNDYTCAQCGKSSKTILLSASGLCDKCRRRAKLKNNPRKRILCLTACGVFVASVVVVLIFSFLLKQTPSENNTLPAAGFLSPPLSTEVAPLENGEVLAAAEGTPAPEETPPPFSPITYTGSGDYYIMDVSLPTGRMYSAKFTHDGKSNYIVHVVLPEKDLLINEIGYYSGAHLFTPGDYGIEVQADGDWTVEFSELERGSSAGESGIGPTACGWFTSTSSCPVAFTHNGESNFIVHLYNITDDARDYVINDIGAYSGTRYVDMDAGKKYCWVVEADGDWSISMDN